MRRLATVILLLGVVAAPVAARPAIAPAPEPAPWLGVGIDAGANGVVVTEVIPGTPAEYVGLGVGDTIVSVAGLAVTDPTDLITRVAAHKVGDVVAIVIVRAGHKRTLRATLSARLEPEEILEHRLLDKPAPAFDLPVVAGKGSGKLADYRHKVVVVEFVASWCGPCKSTYQAMGELAAKDPDLVVLAIAAEDADTIKAFAAREQLGFPVLGDAAGAVSKRYFASATPTFVVVDGDGAVRFVGMGAGVTIDHAVFAATRALRDLERDE